MTTPNPGTANASQPVSGRDRLWTGAAAELTPAKSLARVDERAKQVVANVTLVGSVLTGLGLLASSKLDTSGPGRVIAIAAVCVALVAIVLALASTLLRFTPSLSPGNLAEVEAWYRRQFRWAYWVIAAGVLLLVAVVLAGAATLVVLSGTRSEQPTMSAQVTGTGAAAKVTARVEVAGMAPGQVLRVDVVGVDAAGSSTVLARAVSRGADGGTVATAMEVTGVGGYAKVQVTAAMPGRRCTASVAAGSAGSPATVVCGRR
jgi:hypothetical protein